MASVAVGTAFSQTTGVVCEEFDQIQLTHVLTPTGPLPTALDPNGVYPYMSYSETSNRKVSEKDAFFFCYAARLLSIFIFKTSLFFSIISLREVILQK